VTTKLALGNWLDPRDGNVHDDSDDTDNPKHLREVGRSTFDSCISEDDGEDLRQWLVFAIV
jgi:hypothetical protein